MSKFRLAAGVLSLALCAALMSPAFVSPVLAQGKGEPKPSGCDRYKKGSADWKKCTRGVKDEMSDDEIYYAGYWLARTGQYDEAIEILNKASVKNERILTYIGFATRKRGDHDAAMELYNRALAMNPDYTVARAYMGEALIAKGEIALAREQLAEIGTRCGMSCAEYNELKVELSKVGS
jgi:tetratricopeptide (TPR) repeat protein